MSLHPYLGKLLGRLAPGALFALLAATATGCGGCDNPTLNCDQSGNNCQLCDAYGCHAANPNQAQGAGGSATTATTGTHAGSGGQGGATGQGGAGGAGGQKPCDPAQAVCACDAGSCPNGTQCVSGICINPCQHSYECGTGKVCDNGQCVAGCDAMTACATGFSCAKGVCAPDANNPQCGPSMACAHGQVCVNGLCGTGCTQSSQCAGGDVCDGSSGVCIPNPSPTPSCSAASPCVGTGQVCEADGYCHYPCAMENDCKLIDNRFVACDQGICKTQDEVNPECTLQKPCPAGQDCISNHCM